METISAQEVKRFEDMIERLRAEELEDYEVYGCLAKFVSDNLPENSNSEGGSYATVVSYLDKNNITVDEVLGYVNNDAGQLLSNSPLLQRFTSMMDYMENKGLAAEDVFQCLEIFVESNGQTIYNAFGNLSEVDYFNYATVSGYLNSRGVQAEAVRAFLQHILMHQPDLVASLKPSDDPDFNVGGQKEALAAAADVYETRNAAAASAQHEGTNGATELQDVELDAAAPEAEANGVPHSSRPQSRTEPLLKHEVPLDMLERPVSRTPTPGLVEEMATHNESLQRQVASLERYVQQLEGSRDRTDAFLMRLASSMDALVASVNRGHAKDMQHWSEQLQQLVDHRRALEDTVTYKFTAEDVEGLRSKLRHLHEKLQVNPQSKIITRVKERQLSSFHDFIESIEDAEAEVDRLREENYMTMKTLVLKKVELAESQEEVTKTKRALIRAVNKQMQLALKIDNLQSAYDKLVSKSTSRLLPSFSRRPSVTPDRMSS